MTVKELREKIAALPDETPVLLEYDGSTMPAAVYLGRCERRVYGEHNEFTSYYLVEQNAPHPLALIVGDEDFTIFDAVTRL